MGATVQYLPKSPGRQLGLTYFGNGGATVESCPGRRVLLCRGASERRAENSAATACGDMLNACHIR